MFSRLSQLTRHLSRRLPYYSSISPAIASRSSLGASIMSRSAAEDRSKRMLHTAGCIIIGDEVLGGKVNAPKFFESCRHLADAARHGQTVDTNSAHFAKYCFLLGMNLKRIEVIGDDEAEIGDAARRMSENYDFVVTRQDCSPLRTCTCFDTTTNLQCPF